MKQEPEKLLVFGIGYVGLATGIALSSSHIVHFIDIDPVKIDKINCGICPVEESSLSREMLKNRKMISASEIERIHVTDFDCAYLALPTNFCQVEKKFDTSSIEDVLAQLEQAQYRNPIVIKSTVPVGFTARMEKEYSSLNISFIPEFLREGQSLADTFSPSRVVVGSNGGDVDKIVERTMSIVQNSASLIICGTNEAETIKIFSNTFLACRVALFNEFDTYCLQNGINATVVISGISEDPRIGQYYNNPSFGYGGYCLPKDTQQAQAMVNSSKFNIINNIELSNKNRIKVMAETILAEKTPRCVGLYRPVMKQGSDNLRHSSAIQLGKILSDNGVKVIVYEPSIIENNLHGWEVVNDQSVFTDSCDCIAANRISSDLEIDPKIFSRDIYHVG